MRMQINNAYQAMNMDEVLPEHRAGVALLDATDLGKWDTVTIPGIGSKTVYWKDKYTLETWASYLVHPYLLGKFVEES